MRDLSDTEIARLEALADELAEAGLVPLDAGALDGYLCGVLLQPKPVPEAAWWPLVLDAEGGERLPRTPAARATADALQALVRQRHAWLGERIAARQWFDPWLFAAGDDTPDDAPDDIPDDTPEASLHDSVLPWASGFALAAEHFPGLTRLDPAALAEPLAMIYLHFGADELELAPHEAPLASGS